MSIIFLGVLVAGYGSGLLRLFSLPTGYIIAEITAHGGWITGMDLASQSGLLLTCSEDGFVRVSKTHAFATLSRATFFIAGVATVFKGKDNSARIFIPDSRLPPDGSEIFGSQGCTICSRLLRFGQNTMLFLVRYHFPLSLFPPVL